MRQTVLRLARLSLRRRLTLAVILVLVLPASAAADVLMNKPKSNVACGKSVKLGVWYRKSSGGPRWAHIKVTNSKGKVVWHKNVKATTTWHYWYYKGKCGSHYTATYTTAGGTASFAFHARKKGGSAAGSPGFY